MTKNDLELAQKYIKELVGSWVWIVGDDLTVKHWAKVDGSYYDSGKIVFHWVQLEEGPDLTELWDNGEFIVDDIGVSVLIGDDARDAADKFEQLQMEFYEKDYMC